MIMFFIVYVKFLTSHHFIYLSGVPTLAYGIAGLLWASHTEIVETKKGPITIFFWYQETPKAKF
jgi:hypothetical protein